MLRATSSIVAFACLWIGFGLAQPLFADDQPDEISAAAFQAARAAESRQELTPALIGYLRASTYSPNQADAEDAIAHLISTYGMPHQLTDSDLIEITNCKSLFVTKSVDSGVTLITLNKLNIHSLVTNSDPVNGWPFSEFAAVYSPVSGNTDVQRLVCTIHYQVVSDNSFAEHVGRLLALLKAVLIQRTGHNPSDENPFQVWLSRSSMTPAGGEQWRNNLYLYDIGDGRSSIEWIREIAHEFGHLAIPPLGGDYTEPEPWASGYVGERLMVRWLAISPLAGAQTVEHVWGQTFAGYSNFKTKLIDPELDLYESTGLNRSQLARKDETGMNYLIGLLLWVDENQGGSALGDLLWNMDSAQPIELYARVAEMGSTKAEGRTIKYLAKLRKRDQQN